MPEPAPEPVPEPAPEPAPILPAPVLPPPVLPAPILPEPTTPTVVAYRRVAELASEVPQSTPSPALRSSLRVSWSSNMLEVMLKTFIKKAIDEGLRADNGYKPQVWVAVVEAVNQAAGTEGIARIDRQKCKDKHDACKEDWKQWAALTSLSGVALESKGYVVADRLVIQDCMAAHPKAVKFLRRPIEFPELHRQLFTGVLATGEGAMTIESLLIHGSGAPARSIKRDSTAVSWSLSPSPWQSRAPSESEDSSNISRRKRSGTSSSLLRRDEKRRRKPTSIDRFEQHLARIADALDGLVKSLNKNNQKDAITEFTSTYGALDISMQLAVVNILSNEVAAITFLALRSHPLQKRWVLMQLRKLSATGKEEYKDFAHLCDIVDWDGDGELVLKST